MRVCVVYIHVIIYRRLECRTVGDKLNAFFFAHSLLVVGITVAVHIRAARPCALHHHYIITGDFPPPPPGK